MTGNPYISNAATYLIDVLLGLLLLLVVLRFLMQWARADFRNPVGQFVIQITNPILVPIRRVVPPLGTLDLACALLALVVALAKIWLITMVAGMNFGLAGLLLYAVADILRLVVYIFMAVVLIRIVVSWVAPHAGYSPLMAPVLALSEPIMAPARRLIPAIGGLDLSPIVVFIFLNLTLMLVVDPIFAIAAGMMQS